MTVNKAILIGNLGADPELRYTPSGKAVASFSLATTERFTGEDGQMKESTVWHKIVVWGKQAENVKEYLRKGRQVYVEGRIENRSYDDKEGNKRYVSEIVARNIRFLGTREGAAETPVDTSGPRQAAVPPDASEADDDLPF
ncbi:MAG TPA: single-stranded DNA-binding protein [Candidatus Deferrimicrobium sp.]|nr:single-stranded DNA-binding protein [Candidatus Deferrimicrobium sp.]